MAKKGSLNIIELHVEKVLLGVTVAFLGYLVVHYMMGPNTVEYAGQQVGPDELDTAILAQAEQLKQAVNRASVEPDEVPDFRAQLESEFEAGVLGADDDASLPVPQELRVATTFGRPLPSFEDDDEEAPDIVLVTPLPPVQPTVRTGISVVQEADPLKLGSSAPLLVDDTPAEPTFTEMPWVTFACYYPLEAQRREMVNAGYAGYRSKPYVVGVDVQRREKTASGEWSEWVNVEDSAAMPDVDVPEPVFDDRTDAVVNQEEIDKLLDQVKWYQQVLMQPPFLPTAAGDDWLPPAVPGHEDLGADEEEEEEEAKAPEKDDEPSARAPRAAPTPSRTSPSGSRGRMAGGRGRTSGGRGRFGGGGRAPSTPSPRPQEDESVAARREIREEFKEIRKAIRDRDFSRVTQLASDIQNNQYASRGDKKKARAILERVERAQTRGTGDNYAATVKPSTHPFLTAPEGDNDPAVWFHDTAVEPGKTYRYRMRVKLWNRYVGRVKSLKNRAQAAQSVVTGEWSLPSEPVTVAPKTHFFVTGPRFGEPAARVDVFTWYHGDWLKESFDVAVGDVIGGLRETKTADFDEELKPKEEMVDFGTGAVVLDLRMETPALQRRAAGKEGEFAYSERESLVLVYLDPADGQIKERIDAFDRSDKLYIELKSDYEDLIE